MLSPALVSCIMPTRDRRQFVPRAVAYFLRQDYANRELVVVDDGDDPVADLLPDDERVRYLRLDTRATVGAKRNAACEAAHGELIMNWDDDDWMAPRRISYQVAELLGQGGDVCGLRQMLFYDPAANVTWLYTCTPGQRAWLAGGSLLYQRELWRRAPYPNIQVGEDARFVWSRHVRRPVALADMSFYVALIHAGNTSPKICQPPCWSRWNGDLRRVMGDDLDLYRPAAEAGDGHVERFATPTDPDQRQASHALQRTLPARPAADAERRPQARPGNEPTSDGKGDAPMKLSLGWCSGPVDGFANVDVVAGPGVEVVDLRRPWPWPDSSVEHVRARDIVEHLPDKILTMNELWRVLRPGGTAEIGIPCTDGTGAWQDPTHVSFWNRRSFLYYEDGSPYRERFASYYGIQARFRVVREHLERTADGPQLTIVLEAVKP